MSARTTAFVGFAMGVVMILAGTCFISYRIAEKVVSPLAPLMVSSRDTRITSYPFELSIAAAGCILAIAIPFIAFIWSRRQRSESSRPVTAPLPHLRHETQRFDTERPLAKQNDRANEAFQAINWWDEEPEAPRPSDAITEQTPPPRTTRTALDSEPLLPNIQLPGQPPTEILAWVALVLPVITLGMLLISKPSPGIELVLGCGTVFLTAVFLAVDASFLGQIDRHGKRRKSADVLLLGMALLWPVIYPLVFFRRRHFGRPNRGPVAIVVVVASIAFPFAATWQRSLDIAHLATENEQQRANEAELQRKQAAERARNEAAALVLEAKLAAERAQQFAAEQARAAAQRMEQQKAEFERLNQINAQTQNTLKERLVRVRENLKDFFDRRHSEVIWGTETLEASAFNGSTTGTAVMRFRYLWGNDARGGDKAAPVPYWKKAAAVFQMAGEHWQFVRIQTFATGGSPFTILVDDGALHKALALAANHAQNPGGQAALKAKGNVRRPITKLVLKDGSARAEGQLLLNDPRDTVRVGCPRRVYTIPLQAGRQYQIDLQSRAFDAYLRLEDARKNQLAEDDDSGGSRNARILYQCAADGLYRIIATSFAPGSGPFTLTVQQKDTDGADIRPVPPQREGDARSR